MTETLKDFVLAQGFSTALGKVAEYTRGQKKEAGLICMRYGGKLFIEVEYGTDAGSIGRGGTREYFDLEGRSAEEFRQELENARYASRVVDMHSHPDRDEAMFSEEDLYRADKNLFPISQIYGILIFPDRTIAEALLWKPEDGFNPREAWPDIKRKLERTDMPCDVIMSACGQSDLARFIFHGGVWRLPDKYHEKLEKYSLQAVNQAF